MTADRAPWPYLTQRQAARALGVSVERLTGWANNPIPAVRLETSKGNTIWVFNADAIHSIVAKAGIQQ